MVLGDPGEGDDSQYHVLRPLYATAGGTAFTYIVSDVIYPAGDVNEYEDKFYWPYRRLPGPIYAIPGNHDWYDGLDGFMAALLRRSRRASGRHGRPAASACCGAGSGGYGRGGGRREPDQETRPRAS